ncbi:hypothetical protein HHI36_012022 [Cryptolaemus montrouzieri]|uniref:Solute carrier family 25 member 32 n=1 Tax=Cryptolaemus montrouzieri TaxID=559131 RepID=A0ABD2NDX4_9CUCU
MTVSQNSIDNSKTRVEDVSFLSHVKYEHLVAGVSGGVISSLILHPLDLLKIRFEVNNGLDYNPQYKGIINGLTTIFKQEGVRGLYRGAVPSTIGAGSSWGLYFYFYTALKTWQQDGNIDKTLSPGQHLVAASEAGLFTLVLTNPIWVCKTRLCLQSSVNIPKTHYTGMIDTLVKLYKTEGILGWYKGFLPGMLGVSHGAIQFMAYEQMKIIYYKHKDIPISTKLGVLEYLSFAAISKAIAVSVTYPYQVIRARLQNQIYSFEGMGDCVRQTWLLEGLNGFYKGLGINLLRVVPATMITFVTYENISHFLITFKTNS